jgi:hypothetical protein
MIIYAAGRDQLTRRARSNESEAVRIRHQLRGTFRVSRGIKRGLPRSSLRRRFAQEEKMSPESAISVIAVALALAFSAHTSANHNRGNASSYQSAQYCMPQDDEPSDTTRVYC